jgi:gamma-glutamyltranspeptidase/glutathione hydrolase
MLLALPTEASSQDADYRPPDPEIRPEVGGLHGAVSSDHPLATAAGYEVLRSGGNAVDAAVTMAAILAVVRPHMNSVGGDAFALFYDGASRSVSALNASGRAAAGATPEFFRDQGIDRMPGSGPLSVTVPGAVSAWAEALDRYGTISLAQALAPAIEIARDGFMVTTTLADDLRNSSARLNEGGQAIYRPGGRALEAGDLLKSPQLAHSLERIAAEGPGALYGGSVGASVAAFLEGLGSPLRLSDFAVHRPEWTETIHTEFLGHRVHTVRPNSQGVSLLQVLGMARTLPFAERQPNSDRLMHEMVEFVKLAFADRDRYVADPAFADVPLDRLLDASYLAARAGQVTERAVEGQEATSFADEFRTDETDGGGDTVYLMAVDQWGNAVSWIQSLFGTFGAGIVDPETGIVLQNRGSGFTLDEGHPNQVAPGKRPFHTLMATMVTDLDGEFAMTIGTPGGGGQPQFIAQTLVQMLAFGMSPQQAIEAPRFRVGSGVNLSVEDRLPLQVSEGLAVRGHNVNATPGWDANYGNMQVIRRLPNGLLRTGADMRREGAAMAY